MIFLTGTTKKLQLATSSAATIDVVVNYIESVAATGVTAAIGSQETTIASAGATTDICATASASNVRNVTQITVRNKDASLSCDVTVIVDVSATDYELHKVTLGTGDMLQYIEGVGFFVQTVTAKQNKLLHVTGDYSNSTTSFTGITGLSWVVKSGRNYVFEAVLHYQTAAAGTGAQFAIGGVAMTGMIAGGLQTVTNSVTAAAMSSGVVTAVDTAVIAQTTGPNTTNVPGIISGWFQPSADGTFVIKGASEVAASALTVKKGSWCLVRETDN